MTPTAEQNVESHPFAVAFTLPDVAGFSVPLALPFQFLSALRPYIMDEVRDEFGGVLAKVMTLEYDMMTLVRKRAVQQFKLPMGVIGAPADPNFGRNFLERAFGWGKRAVIRAMESTTRSIDFDMGVILRLYPPFTHEKDGVCLIEFLGEKDRFLRKCCSADPIGEALGGSLSNILWIDASWSSRGDRDASMSTNWGLRKELWSMAKGLAYDPVDLEVITLRDISAIALDEIAPVIAMKIPAKTARVEAMCREMEMQARIMDFFRDKERTGISPAELSNFAREVGNWIRENDQQVIQKRSPELSVLLESELTIANFAESPSLESGR